MTQPKRVLFIDETRYIAGGTNSLLLLLQGIDREKYEPVLVAPEGPFAEAARTLGVTIIPHAFRCLRLVSRVLGRKILNPTGLLFRLWNAIQFIRMARKHEASIIHTNTLNAHISGLLAGKLSGIPVVWHVRRIYTYAPLLFRQRWLPDRIVFVSNAAASVCNVKDRGRVCVIHNGIDVKHFEKEPDAYLDVRQELGISPDERIVGSVGRLDRGKGYEYLIQAIPNVLSSHPNVRFVIVGEEQYGGEYVDGIRQQIADLGIQERVILTGFRTDVARLLSAFDLFVSPSEKDAHPRVVLEAMALGLPIVGTLSGGIAETLEQGISGLLTPVNDTARLADAIVQVLGDPDVAGDLGRNARARVLSDFTAESYVAKVENMYESLSSSSHRI